MSIWSDPRIEKLRDSRRKKGRIAFDCFNLLLTIDDTVYCKKGHCLDSTFTIIPILKGITPGICRKCKDYEEEIKDE